MYTSMLRRALLSSGVSGPKVYGSTVPAQMILDAANGTDSLDVIVIGDSNATFPGRAGYNNAWHRVFNTTLRVPIYATPLFAGGLTNTGGPTAAIEMARDVAGLGVSTNCTAAGVAGTTGAGKMMATSLADSNILALNTYLGNSTTGWNLNDKTTNTLMMPHGYAANPVVVESTGGVFLGTYKQTCVSVSAFASGDTSGATSWGSELAFGTNGLGAGVSLAYRIVYGTFAAGSGQFKPRAVWENSGALHGQDSVFTSTNTGTVGYATKSWTIPAVTYNTAGYKILHCGWDGTATGAASTTGPFACLWNSVVKVGQKGYSVSVLNAFGGLNSALTVSKITNAGKLVDAYLKEIRERQIACGGTGRALVFLNLGTNTVEDATTWTTNAEALVTLLSSKWIALGGAAENISYILTVTHPNTTGAWFTNRPAISSAANAWALVNGVANNICVIDINTLYTATQMSKYNMYDSGGEAHLNYNYPTSGTTITTMEDSYFAIVQGMVSAMISL